jgi:hypothetical protein
MTQRETPKFTGTAQYRDPLGRFSFWYPTDWATFEINEGVPKGRGKKSKARVAAAKRATEANPLPVREGFGAAPNPDDPHTSITCWVSPLAEKAVAEDFADLKAGVDLGFAALEECTVELIQDDVLSNLVKFERVYTFLQDGAVRKRRQWLLYVDTWLLCLTWQGASTQEYKYWLAMANYSFQTFQLPEALWYATDRALSRPSESHATQPAS